MFYCYPYKPCNTYPYYLYQQYLYNFYYSPLVLSYRNPYQYINKGILKDKQNELYREFSFQYITDWFSDKYDEYKEYLFKCFYKYPYEFEKIKQCLQDEYNVPVFIAEKLTNIAQYGYETAGWTDKRLLLNKLSGEWKTKWGILDLYVSEDLVPKDDTVFPYANKVTGSYDWNGGGKIEGSVNWGGVSTGIFMEPSKQGEYKIIFEEDNNGKRTFRGTFTEGDEVYELEGEQIKEG